MAVVWKDHTCLVLLSCCLALPVRRIEEACTARIEEGRFIFCKSSSRTISPSQSSVQYEVQRSRCCLKDGQLMLSKFPGRSRFAAAGVPELERWDCQGTLRREFASSDSETCSSTLTSYKAVREYVGAVVKAGDPPR